MSSGNGGTISSEIRIHTKSKVHEPWHAPVHRLGSSHHPVPCFAWRYSAGSGAARRYRAGLVKASIRHATVQVPSTDWSHVCRRTSLLSNPLTPQAAVIGRGPSRILEIPCATVCKPRPRWFFELALETRFPARLTLL